METPRERVSMRVLGLVPARGGSRRIERKNLARLQGQTLVRRALETALRSGAFATLALSSDDSEILAEAQGLDEVVQVRRPAELAADGTLTYDVVTHALRTLETDKGLARYDAVAVVQCTAPLTAPEDITGAVRMLERTGAGSVVSVVEADSAIHPLKLKRMEGDRLVPFLADDRLTPYQELPELWIRNGSVYVSRRDTIEAGVLLSDDVRGYPMPRERSHDIDTPTDLAFAEFLLERRARGGG
jgi:CMP-N,N'-diacetyllegionaminic acid synthase